MDLALNNLQRLLCHKTQPANIICTTTLGQRGSESIGNEVGTLHSPKLQNLYLTIKSPIQDIRWVGVLLVRRDVVDLFYNPSGLAMIR